MCEICHHIPCLNGCPNASEQKAEYICEECGEGITRGEEFVEGLYGYYHFECLRNMTTREIVKALGEKVRRAG